ncbi:MAG: PKD domain-containing protein, partial [Planctomycetes bacterium]|nr:PKD domain-containing protein [Planctomycetota bacterium]
MKHGWRIFSVLSCCALLSWAWVAVPPALTRGPYLQNTSASGITLVCKTATVAAVTLRYGEQAGPPWAGEASSPAGTTHVFALTGLRPETRYAYELSAGGGRLVGGADCSFRTSPAAESRAPFRFVAWGDSGTGSTAQLDVAARMEAVLPAPEFALGLGDLVYDSGQWEKYDPLLFQPYATLFKSTTFWPALGNHDTGTENGAPYIDAFYLPTQGGAPGHPSNSERYYSFDHGMAHFACVDSESTSTSPGGAQYTWLEDDLVHARARGKRWLFVYMHHPPYTRGTHDSTSESELITLRANLVPLFDAQDVDMVMTGHSHVYERSFLARNHAVLQADLADYTKVASPDGTVYLVTGCGGKTGSGPLDLAIMARAYGDVAGFNAIDVSWSEVRGRFIERDGRTTDLFTVRKAADAAGPRVAALEARGANELALVFDEPVQAGTGAAGAENPGNYALDASAAVLGATLDSDQSTVVLATTTLAANTSYTLDIQGVADAGGRAANESVRFVRTESSAPTGTAVVPQGATWRYFPGASDPGAGWAAPGFDDSGWSQGPAGFGFGDNDDATVLAGMQGVYASSYARIAFQVNDPTLVTAMTLRVNYDDGFAAFLNGNEIARDRLPAGATNTTLASGSHEAGTFASFDASAALGSLVAGTNVLALQGHNSSLTSNDFSLHPELLLVIPGSGSDGAPIAVLDAPVRTANAPARLAFSAARSTDGDAALASASWDFGDGSPRASGLEVEHLYTAAGTYRVTLVVRDADGLEALAETSVRLHTQGSAPRAELAAGATQVAPGGSIGFDSAGSLDPDGGPVTLHWDFGDPVSGASNASSLGAPTHTYARVGHYT